MAELTGKPGFAPPPSARTLSRRRAAALELIATITLTICLAIAAIAVTKGNRSSSRGDAAEWMSARTRTGPSSHARNWQLISARPASAEPAGRHTTPLPRGRPASSGL